MATELSEQSTTEEVQEYVEQVVQEVESERAGTEKDDARITSEHADNEHKEKTPVDETHSVDDTADSAPADEGETPGELESQDWLTDEVKAEAAAYGIEESEIADFASREELDRALRLFDKTALEAGRKAMAESEGEETGQARNEKGQFVKQDDTPAPKSETKEGVYEISDQFKEEYDEVIVGEVTRMRDHYESRLDALEQRFLQADARAQEQHFDNLVDSLGHADLFGKTGKENPKQMQRREDLHVAVHAQLIGLEKLGRPADLNESLVNRVARMVFADELGKKDLKAHTRKISKQSNGRQGGGTTRPTDPPEDPRDEFDRLYKELAGA